jgi:phosphatidylglycerophosphate synthase
MYAMICCRDHHEYSTWTKKATTLVWMNLPMVQCTLWSVVETFLNIQPGLKKHHIGMNLPMVQCMLWSVVETIMNIQPGLKKPPHWYEPSNGTMYAMVCCRDHHEYSTWTKKPTTLVWMNLPMVQCTLWSVVETIMNIQPELKNPPH